MGASVISGTKTTNFMPRKRRFWLWACFLRNIKYNMIRQIERVNSTYSFSEIARRRLENATCYFPRYKAYSKEIFL